MMTIVKDKVYLLDGGFSSQISKYYNLNNFTDHPLWTSLFLKTAPDAVRQTHLDFLKAGSEIITTNSYQASIEGFQTNLNLDVNESIKLIKKSVELAQEACDIYLKETSDNKCLLIAGSIGPYGAFLNDASEYNGSYKDSTCADVISQYHRKKIEILTSAGVDLIAIETIPVMSEAKILVELLKEFPQVKAWLSFSCRDEQHINSGESFFTAATECYKSNPDQLIAIGVNCTNPDYVESLIKDLQTVGDIPVIVYPNSGEKYDNHTWVGKSECKPLHFYLENWMKLNVKFVGGCCRIDAEVIASLRKKIDQIQT